MPTTRLEDFVIKKSIRAESIPGYEEMAVLGVSNKLGITVTDHKKSKDLAKYLLIEEGDFAYNPYRINVGSIGLVPAGTRGLVSPAYVVFTTTDRLIPELLLDFLKSQEGLRQIGKYARGTVRKALRFEDLTQIELPIPPMNNQMEILSKRKSIETEVDLVKSELTHQQTLLKKLRQQILQEAIEGKLTADWRAQNPDMEPASELLKRIAAEKAQLVKNKKIKAQKPLPPITDEEKPFELPQGWEWCQLGMVTLEYEAGKSFKCEERSVKRGEWGVIKTSAVTSSFFNENENKFYRDKKPAGALKIISEGDLIFCRASGSKGLTGKCCVVRSIKNNLLLSDKTPRLKLSRFVNISFVFFHNETEHTSNYYSSLNTGKSTSMNNITKEQLLNKIIPLPPVDEQQAIVNKVEKLFALCDQLETQITQNQSHAEQLIQAVLKEAFSHNSEVESSVEIQ